MRFRGFLNSEAYSVKSGSDPWRYECVSLSSSVCLSGVFRFAVGFCMEQLVNYVFQLSMIVWCFNELSGVRPQSKLDDPQVLSLRWF